MNGRGASRLARAALHAALVAGVLVVIAPFVWMLVSSFKTTGDFFGSLFLPSGDGVLGVAWSSLTLANYAKLIELGFWRAFVNSVFYASTNALVSTLLCSAAGYAFAAYRFRGRGVAGLLVLAALVVPPALLIAPTYALLHRLGLLDTSLGLIAPMVTPAFGVFLFRQAVLQSVPIELIESARVDGSSEVRIFFLIVIPMLRPMIGAFMLISFMAMWNNFLLPQIVIQSAEKQPLSVAITQLKGVYTTDYGLMMAATVVSVAPPAALFLLLQREFLRGFTVER